MDDRPTVPGRIGLDQREGRARNLQLRVAGEFADHRAGERGLAAAEATRQGDDVAGSRNSERNRPRSSVAVSSGSTNSQGTGRADAPAAPSAICPSRSSPPKARLRDPKTHGPKTRTGCKRFRPEPRASRRPGASKPRSRRRQTSPPRPGLPQIRAPWAPAAGIGQFGRPAPPAQGIPGSRRRKGIGLRHRTAEMVALAQGAAHRRQGLRLGAALDALRDRRDPDLLGEPQDGLDDPAIARLRQHRPDEGPVDLQRGDRQGAEMTERGIARAEIVHRDAEAGRAAARKGGGGAGRILHQRALGDLELEGPGAIPVRRSIASIRPGMSDRARSWAVTLKLTNREASTEAGACRPPAGSGARSGRSRRSPRQ